MKKDDHTQNKDLNDEDFDYEEEIDDEEYISKENKSTFDFGYVGEDETKQKKFDKICATELLMNIFVNERGIIADICRDNEGESTGIKAKYKNFNPENIMGYSATRLNGIIKVRFKRDKSFTVSTLTEKSYKDIEGIKYPYYKILKEMFDENEFPAPKIETDEGKNIVAEFRDGSRYLCDTINNKNSISFKGYYPIVISNEEAKFLEKKNLKEIIEFIKKHEKTGISKYSSETEFRKNILTFDDCATGISNSLAHNSYKDLGEFIIVNYKNPSNHFEPVLISKTWMKAVAETLIKAKDQVASIDDVLGLIDIFEKEQKLTLDDDVLADFLESNFEIEEEPLNFMINLIQTRLGDKVKKSKGFTDETREEFATLIDFYQENFRNDRLDVGISLPSKAFLYLLSQLEYHYDSFFTEDFLYNSKLQFEMDLLKSICDIMDKKIFQLKIKNKNKNRKGYNNYFDALQNKSKALEDKYQKELNSRCLFFHHGIIYTCDQLERGRFLGNDVSLAFNIASLSRPINEVYSKIPNTISKYKDSKKPEEIAKRKKSQDILKTLVRKHPNLFNRFEIYIDDKTAIIKAQDKNYSYRRLFSHIRNSSTHSAISLILDKKGNTQLIFHSINGLPNASEAGKARDESNKDKPQYTIICYPDELLTLYKTVIGEIRGKSGIFNYEPISPGRRSYGGGKNILHFDEKGLTIIRDNNDGSFSTFDVQRSPGIWKDINKNL